MVSKVPSEFGFSLVGGGLFWFNDCDVVLLGLVSVFGWVFVVLRDFWLWLNVCLCVSFNGVVGVYVLWFK